MVLIVLAAVVSITAANPASADRRVALVIGNARYEHADKLTNPTADARAMRDALTKLGFEVIYGEDFSKRALERALGRFANEASGADVGLVYFAGHGATFDGVSYVVPTDAEFSSVAEMPYQLMPVETLIGELRRAKGLRIAILDACRDDSKEAALKRTGERGGEATRGLGRVKNPDGLIIAYATQFLSTAADGPENGDSPFTAALVANLLKPGLDVKDVFFQTGDDVETVTNKKQRPEISVSFYGRYVLAPAAVTDAKPVAPPASAPVAVEPPVAVAKPVPVPAAPAPQQQAMLAPAPPASVLQPAPITDCDRLARSPIDEDGLPNVVSVFDDEMDSEKATQACRAAVDLYPNEPRLMLQLGRALIIGKQHEEEGVRILRKAADSGYVPATVALGALYQSGQGIAKDDAEALRLCRKAADGGSLLAHFCIASLYRSDQAVAKEAEATSRFSEAIHLARTRAEAGNVYAMTWLGTVYRFGRFGMAVDKAEAIHWLSRAADLGGADAKRDLQQLQAEKPKEVASLPSSAVPSDSPPTPSSHAGAGLKLAHRLDGATGPLAVSADGRTLAAGGNAIKLWDVTTGQALQTVDEIPGNLEVIALSPDGQMLASVTDVAIKLWQAASGRLLRMLKVPDHGAYVIDRGVVTSVAFSPDGKTLAAGCEDPYWHNSIIFWDVTKGRLVRVIKDGEDGMFSLTFAPDGRTLASASRDHGTVKLWDVANGRMKRSIDTQSAQTLSIAFSPDGQTLASTAGYSGIKLWDVTTAQLKQTIGSKGNIGNMKFFPDGQTLVSTNSDGGKVWDVKTGQLLRTLDLPTAESAILSPIAPDGRTFVSLDDHGIKVWTSEDAR